jgi:hypothetical protein
MEPSFHSPFLPLFCGCQFRRLDSIQFQAHIPAGLCLEARPFTSVSITVLYYFYYFSSDLLCPFITPRYGPHGKHSLSLRRSVYWSVTQQWMSYCRVRGCCVNVFTESLPSNGYTCHSTNLNVEDTIIIFIAVWV